MTSSLPWYSRYIGTVTFCMKISLSFYPLTLWIVEIAHILKSPGGKYKIDHESKKGIPPVYDDTIGIPIAMASKYSHAGRFN